MKEYTYYPGCSLEHTGKPYDMSIREVFKSLDITLKELDDWNCCGATMYMSVDKTVGYAVSARNLALAQKLGNDVCAPCSSCYTVLRKTNRHLSWNEKSYKVIAEALGAANLTYDRSKPIEIRHPLDILVNDIGIEVIADKAKFSLKGLKVAPYYGCQIVRPVKHFDDMDEPDTMDRLLAALGAEVVHYPEKVRCCGGMLMTTFEDAALELNNTLIEAAIAFGGEIIATTCPLCQMNLEAYQPKINAKFNQNYNIPVVYFSQLVGMALGISPEKLGLDILLVQLPNNQLKLERRAAV